VAPATPFVSPKTLRILVRHRAPFLGSATLVRVVGKGAKAARGAFTTAVVRKPSLLVVAGGGTSSSTRSATSCLTPRLTLLRFLPSREV
jgi:hypothetical protein